jgi:uncharacterized protein (DUF952 family)
MDGTIFKVCNRDALTEAQREGRFEGSRDDRRDGYIHFSTAEQLDGTLAKHFAGQQDLILLAVDVGRLGERLQWEPSRDGTVFPHLYGPLDLNALLWAEPLALGPDGRHLIPVRVLP